MSKLVSLESLIGSRQVWRGQPANLAPSSQPTGHAALDEALPSHGWPEASLTELLLPMHGVGELELMWPTLARLSQGLHAHDAIPSKAASPSVSPSKATRSQTGPAHDGGMIVLIDPPYLPYPPAWRDAGVVLSRLQIVRAHGRDALWAAEQCLRSGACAAVLCWPQRADDRALRRLQVAAETGQCLGFALRDSKAALNPSPAALRIAIDTSPRQLRVLKCRGGNAPTRPIAFPLPADASTRATAPMPIAREFDAIGLRSVGSEGPPTKTSVATLESATNLSTEIFCGKDLSPDALRSAAAIRSKSIGPEDSPTTAREAAKSSAGGAVVAMFRAPTSPPHPQTTTPSAALPPPAPATTR